MTHLVAAAVIAAAGATLAAAAPSKAAVTLGPVDTDEAPDGLTGCGAEPCTFAHRSATDVDIAAPFDGVLVRWRIRTANGTEPFRLRVVREVMPGLFTGAGSSDPKPVAPGAEHTFASRVPIEAGDLIAVDGPPSADAALGFRSITGATGSSFRPPLADSGDPRTPNGGSGGFLALFNADLEPDCDHDGLGDESQDPSTLACRCGGLTATIVGENGRDRIKGTPARDVISARGGKDVVRGHGGGDVICGGRGGDKLRGNRQGDILLGAKGDDSLFGQAGRDELRGGRGRDLLNAGSSLDACRGGAGRDREVGCFGSN